MSDEKYQNDLYDFMQTKSASYRKRCRINSKIADVFNATYGFKKTPGGMKKRVKKEFSMVHLRDMDILTKVAILFVFCGILSDEMKQELALHPSFFYSLNKKGQIVRFDSGDGSLVIDESYGKRRRAENDAADGAPPPRRMRLDSNSDEENIGVDEMRAELPEEAGEHHVDAIHGGPLDGRQRMDEADHGAQQEDPADGLEFERGDRDEEERKPNVLELAPTVKPEPREIKQESDRAANASRDALGPMICANQLAAAFADLASAVQSEIWNRKAAEIGRRLGDDKMVPVVDFKGALDLVWFKANRHKKTGLDPTGFDPTDIRLPLFFAALQSCVILPFGEELMREQWERIDREQKIMVNMAEKAKAKGEPVEIWMLPKNVAEACLRILVSMSFYC